MNDQDLLNHLRKVAASTTLYKNLMQTPYRRIKNYPRYESIVSDIAVHLVIHELRERLGKLNLNDIAWHVFTDIALTLFSNPKIPVYAITPELIEAFVKSDLPPDVCDIKKSFSVALFIFPKMFTTPDNEPFSWLLSSYFAKDEIVATYPSYLAKGLPESMKSRKLESSRIRWVSKMPSGIIYSSVLELKEGLGVPYRTGNYYCDENIEKNPEQEKQFAEKIDNLMLQTLLYLQTKPDEIPTINNVVNRITGGFGKTVNTTINTELEPIWIGKNYRPQIRMSTSTGTHASPRTHWRRGHWKRVAIGEKRLERKWNWIKPTLVNSD